MNCDGTNKIKVEICNNFHVLGSQWEKHPRLYPGVSDMGFLDVCYGPNFMWDSSLSQKCMGALEFSDNIHQSISLFTAHCDSNVQMDNSRLIACNSNSSAKLVVMTFY